MKKKIDKMVINAQVKSNQVLEKVMEVFRNSNGNFFEEALKYIIAIVIGLLFLGGVYVLFKDIIIPTLGIKVKAIFDFKG